VLWITPSVLQSRKIFSFHEELSGEDKPIAEVAVCAFISEANSIKLAKKRTFIKN